VTLQGSWQIDKNNRIVYAYDRDDLRSGRRQRHRVVFKGRWKISPGKMLSYSLSGRSGSSLDFKVSLAKPTRRGLKWSIGAQAGLPSKKLAIFGSWRLTERLGLVLEIDCQDGRPRQLVFGTSFRFDSEYNLEFTVRTGKSGAAGAKIKLSREILRKNGELFLTGEFSGRRQRIMAGVAIAF
jgi:hypothetical protein